MVPVRAWPLATSTPSTSSVGEGQGPSDSSTITEISTCCRHSCRRARTRSVNGQSGTFSSWILNSRPPARRRCVQVVDRFQQRAPPAIAYGRTQVASAELQRALHMLQVADLRVHAGYACLGKARERLMHLSGRTSASHANSGMSQPPARATMNTAVTKAPSSCLRKIDDSIASSGMEAPAAPTISANTGPTPTPACTSA